MSLTNRVILAWIIAAVCVFVLAWSAYAGDTYDVINSKGDYINYGPAVPVYHNTESIVARDSSRYEPRWGAMLSPDDWRDLLFLENTPTQSLIIHQRP